MAGVKRGFRSVFNVLKAVVHLLDGFLFILTPLIIILFIILVIVTLDNFGNHWALLRLMETDGEVVQGKMMDTYDPAAEDETYLAVQFAAYYNPEEIGLVRIAYYSEQQLSRLREGDPVEVRYLPNEIETVVMLEQYFNPPANFFQLNKVNLILLAICWLIIAWHPQMLYLGYMDQKVDPFARFIKRPK